MAPPNDSLPRDRATYADRPVTKPPEWHGLVAADAWFNSMTTGLFIVAALAELIRPDLFGSLGRIAIPIALVWLVADLVCLVLDLGDPLRFHHMMRVFKPSSPMSLGVWALTLFSFFPTALVVLIIDLLRRILLAVGIVPALATAGYKGVLFSTTSQPVWRDARWLGSYLTISAFVVGVAQLALLTTWMTPSPATGLPRQMLIIVLCLSVFPSAALLRETFAGLVRTHGRTKAIGLVAVLIALGVALPIALLLADRPQTSLCATLLVLTTAAAVRFELVLIPHLCATTVARPS